MPDQDAAFMQQQQDLLREIRDELRQTRSINQAQAPGGIQGPAGIRGASYQTAQRFGDMAGMGVLPLPGWANAYKQGFNPTLLGSIGASMGMSRAPNTMSQTEYERQALGYLGMAAPNALMGMLAPGYVSATNRAGLEIAAYSGTFARFGSPFANGLGAGFSSDQSFNAARRMGLNAALDPRLSFGDHDSIRRVSMESGQFDQSRGVDSVVGKMRELATEVARLTRVMHMGAGEVATAMGSLRQFGVQDVGAQGRILGGLAAAGAVAGISTNRMVNLAGSLMSQGAQFGINAEATAGLAGRFAANARTLTQTGLVDTATASAAGGAEGYAQQVSAAAMRLAASPEGVAMFLGGASRGQNAITAGLTGMKALYSSRMGVFGAGILRRGVAGQITADDADSMMQNTIETRLRSMGISSMTSDMAQSFAFEQAQGLGLDESAAQMYVASRFTSAGRAAGTRDRASQQRARRMQAAQDAYSRKQEIESIFGTTHAALGGITSAVSGAYGSLVRESQHLLGFDGAGMFDRNNREVALGVRDIGAMSNADIAAGLFSGASTSSVFRQVDRVNTALKYGAITAGALVAGGIVAPAGAAGALAAGGMGLTMLGAGVASVGGGVAASVLASQFLAPATTDYTGAAGSAMNALVSAAGSTNIYAGDLSRFAKDSVFQKLANGPGGALRHGELRDTALQVADVSRRLGVSTADVVGALRSQGVAFEAPADTYGDAAAGGLAGSAAYKALFAYSTNGYSTQIGVAAAVKDLLKAGNDPVATAKALQTLSLQTNDADFVSRVKAGIATGDKAEILKGAENQYRFLASQGVQKNVLGDYGSVLAGEVEGMTGLANRTGNAQRMRELIAAGNLPNFFEYIRGDKELSAAMSRSTAGGGMVDVLNANEDKLRAVAGDMNVDYDKLEGSTDTKRMRLAAIALAQGATQSSGDTDSQFRQVLAGMTTTMASIATELTALAKKRG